MVRLNPRLDFHKNITINGYDVYNSQHIHLGTLTFHEEWDQWLWSQFSEIILDKSCILELYNFMEDLSLK